MSCTVGVALGNILALGLRCDGSLVVHTPHTHTTHTHTHIHTHTHTDANRDLLRFPVIPAQVFHDTDNPDVQVSDGGRVDG